jgi:poly-gamma-glutamate capsule biosynthesis protein CapA/YwtB (metallophosphatase superfamily)
MLLYFAVAALAGPYADGVAHLRAGRGPAAVVALQAATEAEPERADAWWELGWAHWVTDDLAAAADAWDRVVGLDPGRADLQFWRAVARTRSDFAATPPSTAPIETTPVGARISLAAAGDTMLGSEYTRRLPPADGAGLLSQVAPLLSKADLTFLNLEGPIADDLPQVKCRPDSTSCYAFRTPSRYVKVLQEVGLDLASLANNHAFDAGAAGQEATMAVLDAAGIAHAGRYGDVGRVEVDGVKVALLAAHSGACCLNVNDLDEVRAAITLADQEADVVILSFHGGAEGAGARHVPGRVEVAWGEQRGDVKALAHAAVDAGADVVLGHGPHVLRAMELYQGRLIAYSLGNFIGYKQFGRGGGVTGTSVVLEVELAANGVLTGAMLHPVVLDGDAVPRPDPTGRALTQIRELSAADFPTSPLTIGEDGVLSW